MPVSKSWAIINDHSLRYELSGSGEETIVLCHELGGALESWDRVILDLGSRYRVLRYDQRGSGLSEKVEQLEFSVLVDDLDKLLDHVGMDKPVHLVGVAAGAAVAVQYAVAHSTKVTSLTLSNPALNVPLERQSYLKERAASVFDDGMSSVEAMSLAKSYPDAVRHNVETFRAYRGLFLGNDPRSYGVTNLAFASVDATQQLNDLHCPTLVLAGSVDQLRPPATVRTLLKGHPLIEFEEIEGGHILPLQSPRGFTNRLLAFLNVVSPLKAEATHPRITLLRDEDFLEAHRRVAECIASGPRGKVSPPFRAWLNSPKFADVAQQLGAFLRYETALGSQISETAILVVASHWSCRYEWHIHAMEAVKAGVPEHVISLIDAREDPENSEQRLSLTIIFVRAVLANNVPASLYKQAEKEFGVTGVVELIGLVGYYSMMAMTLNTFRILPQIQQVP